MTSTVVDMGLVGVGVSLTVVGVGLDVVGVTLTVVGRELCDRVTRRRRLASDDDAAAAQARARACHPSAQGRGVQDELWQTYLSRKDVRRGPALDVWLSRHGRSEP